MIDRFCMGGVFVYLLLIAVIFGTVAAEAFREGAWVPGVLLAIGSGAIGLGACVVLRVWK